jgi:uncharacterized protein
MPGGWSKRYECDKLADSHSVLEYELPVSELVQPEQSVGGGPLQLRVVFSRQHGWPVAELELSGTVQLHCQRCLGPMPLLVASKARVLLLASELDGARVPSQEETFLAADGRVSAAELAAEELLLALPQAPRHVDAAQCAAQDFTSGALDPEVQRPFAELRSLLERK